ncbi:MAG: cobalamin B12-binding domain-containing protein [Candidatus Hydrogenedentes bacterium]|nr:cobalamin B12-binding domain-containing protein [Candidatus Hydrogenedentota bacterium]
MSAIVEQIAICIERGKVKRDAPYPPDLKDQDGAGELTRRALEDGIPPGTVLAGGLIAGMSRVGRKYSEGKAFVPDLLMAAKAMKAAMVHLKPYFDSGETHHRGTVVIGTVQGDLHDIGKNLVAMMLEGGGFKVIDLGVDVPAGKFVQAVQEYPGCAVGLSALLTTTMVNMEGIIKAIREVCPATIVLVGGAPVNGGFAQKISATAYAPDPQTALDYLNAT